MLPSRDAYDSDSCPVQDDLLGQMYRANEHGLALLVETVSSDVRAMLALFCYRRSHLHTLALSIASSCTERELVHFGGRVGSMFYALSRETPASRTAVTSSYNNRKPITLSTKPLSTFTPIEDELDDEDLDDEDVVEGGHGVRRVNPGCLLQVCLFCVRRNDNSSTPAIPMPPPRHGAFGVAGHAGSAYLGPHRIDRARRRLADLA